MMLPRRGRLTVIAAILAVTGVGGGGCALISGAGDLHVGNDDDDAGANADATSSSDASGSGDGNGSGADGDTPANEDDGGPKCVAPSSCKAPAPVGWEGPFAVAIAKDADGEKGLTCSPTPAFVRTWTRTGAVDAAGAPPAACTCTCGAIGGTCTVTLHTYDDEECPGAGGSHVLALGNCVDTTSDGFKAAAEAKATCPADGGTTVTPLDVTGTIAVGCAPAAPQGCSQGGSTANNEICFPPLPPEARFCIRPLEGTSAEECPPAFSNRVVLASGVEDSRGCSPCACSPVGLGSTAPGCTFSYALYEDDGCTGTNKAYGDIACHAPASVDSYRLNAATVTGSCSPSGGTAIGGVSTKAASILCCAP